MKRKHATKKKKRFISLAEQEKVIADFIENLDSDDITEDIADIPHDPFIGSDSESEDENLDLDDSDLSEVEIELPRKLKYKSLDECADENKYDPIPLQEPETFEYISSDKKFK